MEFDINYGEGISKEGELIDLGTFKDIIKKSGTWYFYNNERLAQGRENVKVFLKENPGIAKQIEQELREVYGIGGKKKKAGAPTEKATKK